LPVQVTTDLSGAISLFWADTDKVAANKSITENIIVFISLKFKFVFNNFYATKVIQH